MLRPRWSNEPGQKKSVKYAASPGVANKPPDCFSRASSRKEIAVPLEEHSGCCIPVVHIIMLSGVAAPIVRNVAAPPQGATFEAALAAIT
jgi:hypothetical protein